MRLSASDVDWSFGKGAEVHATAESLVLALAGRPVASDEFTGPGACTLVERLAV